MKMKAPSAKNKKRILIVDDHPMMRQGLSQLISLEPDLAACGESATAEQALDAVRRLKPDLVLADISLPGKNGLELIKDFHAVQPGLPVLVISMHDESLYTERVLRAGGRGYIMKQEGGEKLMQAIRRVLEGKIYVSEKMSALILESFSGVRSGGENSEIEKLSDREFEVFQHIGQGLKTRDIAEKLHLSIKTVDVHRTNIKKKLGLPSAPALIRFAVRWIESSSSLK
jgi:DNA-binding NarL/FixJ family response regulator